MARGALGADARRPHRAIAGPPRSWRRGGEIESSEKHRISLGTSIDYVEGEAAKAATVNDIAGVVEKLRKTLGAKHPRSFNLARVAALAFLRDTVTKSHKLWNAVRDIDPRKVPKRAPAPARASRRRSDSALPVRQVCLTKDVRHPRSGRHPRASIDGRRPERRPAECITAPT